MRDSGPLLETGTAHAQDVVPQGVPAPSPTAAPRGAGRLLPLWVVLGSLALAAVYGRVALLNLTTALVGGNVDGYENVWNNWWLKTALFDLHQSPFYTDYIYYPYGVSLRFHTLAPFNGLVTLPFNLWLGYIPTLNLYFVVSLAATTVAAFWMIRDLAGSAWAAFAGAALFTYASPLVLGYFIGGQSNLLAAEWLPLFLFCVGRALRGRPVPPGGGLAAAHDLRRWPVYAAAAVATLLIMSLTEWQYVLFAVVTTVLLFGFGLLEPIPRRVQATRFGKLALIGGAYALIAGPTLVWPMVQEAAANPWLDVSYQSVLHSVDLFDLLGPGLTNPGYPALLLAAAGLWLNRRSPAGPTARTWAAVAVVMYVLALGPVLQAGGTNTGIPLPYGALQSLPVLSIGRDPARFATIGLLGVSILAAFGLRDLAAGAARRLARPGRRLLLSAGLAVLLLAVSLPGYVAAAGDAVALPPDWPPFYAQLAQDPTHYAVLELPLFTEKGLREHHYQFYQVLSGKYRFGGRYARDHALSNPHNFVKTASLFHDLWLLDDPAVTRDLFWPAHDFLQRTDYATQGLAILNYYDVHYIVLYNDALYPGWDEGAFQHILTQILGPNPQPTYQDRIMRVYAVPQGPPPANPITLDAGLGWSPAETRADGKVFRLADNRGGQASQLYTMNLTRAPQEATLHFTVYAFQQPRTLTVRLNGQARQTLHLTPDPQDVTIALTLPPGNNMITFDTPEPLLPTGNPADARLLSFGMYDVALQPTQTP